MALSLFTKQLLDFQKMSIDQTFEGITAMQDYSETVFDTVTSQSPWIYEESITPIKDSIKIMKSLTEEYKTVFDQGYSELDKLIPDSNS